MTIKETLRAVMRDKLEGGGLRLYMQKFGLLRRK
jgi:hypothetical protein